MIRTLNDNPFVAEACGFDWPDIPHEATFSRFFKKLSSQLLLPRVKDVSRSLVRRQYEQLPGFGKRVALDATTLKAWSNPAKKPPSDGHAKWSVKKNTHGKNEFLFGYKLHLLVDCEYELPIAANVSPGNVADVVRGTNVLSEARFTYSRFKPRHVMADAGYSSAKFRTLIKRQYWATPVIDPNSSHRKAVEFARGTPGFGVLRKQRQAVERAFSRLKGQRSLNSLRVRRRGKVMLHCYLSIIAMQAGKVHSESFPSQKQLALPLDRSEEDENERSTRVAGAPLVQSNRPY